MAFHIKWEEAIIQRLDLDEIDLVTEWLKVFSGWDSNESFEQKPQKVP